MSREHYCRISTTVCTVLFIRSMVLIIRRDTCALAKVRDAERNHDSAWLGGFFQPEAYITATRQAVAHAKGWSLEQLVLHLEMEDSNNEGYRISGMSILTS